MRQAAIMRAGLNEMRTLAAAIYPSVRDGTFFESCGVADLIATCYGGMTFSKRPFLPLQCCSWQCSSFRCSAAWQVAATGWWQRRMCMHTTAMPPSPSSNSR